MSYRDYIEAQKKYIETKKQALLDENGRDRCQRPYGDPPPAVPKWWVIAGVTALILLPAILFCFTARIPALAEDDTLTLAVLATEAEFMQIKSWLDPEILANGLTWKIEHYPTRRNLEHHLVRGPVPDLLIIEAELAQEYFLNRILATLWEKGQNASFENSFHPLWEPGRFRKAMGLAAPGHGNVEQARHLCTMIRQFVAPFSP